MTPISLFIDSLYPLKYNLIPDNAKVIDIGCGAGFPGLPLKMMKKDIDISFVDSTEKKLRFTSSVSDRFSLNAQTYPARAEELVAKGNREVYDVCVSRAVASLQVLCELCLPYVKKDGVFIAYKSMKECDDANTESELFKAKKAGFAGNTFGHKLGAGHFQRENNNVRSGCGYLVRNKNRTSIRRRTFHALRNSQN